MRVSVELYPARKETSVELPGPATGMDLLRALSLPPDGHILTRGDVPIPIDEALAEGERIRVISVVSGGTR